MGVIVTPTPIYGTSKVGYPSSVTPIRTPILGSTAVVAQPTVVVAQVSTIMPTNFFIYRGVEGPQLVISWEPPSPALTSDYRLVRREYDFPTNPDDGIVVFTTEDGITPFFTRSYTDLPTYYFENQGITGKGIAANKVYYYRFFAKSITSGQWVTDEENLGRGMGLNTGYFPKKLWECLPAIYHTQDGEV